MGIDKKIIQTPTSTHLTTQQKRHSIKSALKNGGADVFDGVPALKPLCQIPCLSGKEQGILTFFVSFGDSWSYTIKAVFLREEPF